LYLEFEEKIKGFKTMVRTNIEKGAPVIKVPKRFIITIYD
jgi:propanediol dehydratase small subunit